jgi:hypothetical protein
MAVPDHDWQTESDLRTLTEAEEIRKDKKRFAKAKELAKKKLRDMAAVAGKHEE